MFPFALLACLFLDFKYYRVARVSCDFWPPSVRSFGGIIQRNLNCAVLVDDRTAEVAVVFEFFLEMVLGTTTRSRWKLRRELKKVVVMVGRLYSGGEEMYWLHLRDPLRSILRQIYLLGNRDLSNISISVDDCD